MPVIVGGLVLAGLVVMGVYRCHAFRNPQRMAYYSG